MWRERFPPVPHLVGNRCFVVRVLFRVGNRYRCRLWVFLVSSICVIDSTFVGEMIVSRQVSGEVFLLFLCSARWGLNFDLIDVINRLPF